MSDWIDIDGIHARPPVGALLRMGRKSKTNGAPDRDSLRTWWVVDPSLSTFKVQGRGKDRTVEFHALHPAFEAFHAAPEADRRTVTVEIDMPRWEDAAHIGRRRRDAPNGDRVEDGRPWCFTSGKQTASRWDGTRGTRKPIRCAGDACPHAQGGPQRCSVSVRLRGRLVWDDTPFEGRLPSVAFEWSSGGWGSAGGIAGVYEELSRAWLGHLAAVRGVADIADLDLPDAVRQGAPTFLVQGLRVRLTLTRQHAKGRVFSRVLAELVTPASVWLRDHSARMAAAAAMFATPAPRPLAVAVSNAAQIETTPTQGQIIDPVEDIRTTPEPEPVEPVVEPDASPGHLTAKQHGVIEWLASRGVTRADAEAALGRAASDWTTDDKPALVALVRS